MAHDAGSSPTELRAASQRSAPPQSPTTARETNGTAPCQGEARPERDAPSVPVLGSGPPRWRGFRVEMLGWIVAAIVAEAVAFQPLRDLTLAHSDRLHAVGKFRPPSKLFQAIPFISDWIPATSGLDSTDKQWRDFVSNLAYLIVGFAAFLSVSQGTRRLVGEASQLGARVLSGLLFVFYLHGTGALAVLGIFLLNYGFAQLHRCMNRSVLLLLLWAVQIAVLFGIDWIRSHQSRYDALFEAIFGEELSRIHFSGVTQWYYLLAPSVLRMISFTYDVAEAAKDAPPTSCVPDNTADGAESKRVPCLDCAMRNGPSTCYKHRSSTCRPRGEYNLAAYLAYMLYPPLYIAGPIVSFNAFMSYHASPMWMKRREIAAYVFQVVRLFVFTEILLHFYHFNAVRAELTRMDSVLYSSLTLAEIFALGLFGLAFLWLKFSVIWKTFRAAALMDGVEPPENMQQCFSNVHSVADFWQHWHASVNVWAVRYMYVPLGGARYKLITVFPIFAFIALWHDIKLQLLYWAMIMCVFMIVESIIMQVFMKSKLGALKRHPAWRFIRSTAALGSCFALVAANVIGFGGGLDTTHGPTPVGSMKPIVAGVLITWIGSNIGVIVRDNRAWLRKKQIEYYLGGGSPRMEE